MSIPEQKKYGNSKRGDMIDVHLGMGWRKQPVQIKKGKIELVKPRNKAYRPSFVRAFKVDEEGEDINEEGGQYGDEEDVFMPADDEDLGEDAVEGLNMEYTSDYFWESGTEFIEKNVELYPDQHSSLVKALGKEQKALKLVPINVRRRVQNAKINYFNTVQMQIGPLGVLQPARDPNRSIRMIGDELPIIVGDVYSPKKNRPVSPPLSYGGSLRFGDRVKFDVRISDVIQGIIINMGKKTYEVVNVDTGEKISLYYDIEVLDVMDRPLQYDSDRYDYISILGKDIKLGKDKRKWGEIVEEPQEMNIGDLISIVTQKIETVSGDIIGFTDDAFKISSYFQMYLIPFDSMSIKKISRKGTIVLKTPDKMTTDDLLSMPVTEDLRHLVRDVLFIRFSEVIGNVKIKESQEDVLTQAELSFLSLGIRPWKRAKIFKKSKTKEWIARWEFEGEKFERGFKTVIFDNFTQEQIDFAEEGTRAEAKIFASNDFYSENFRSWTYANMYPSLKMAVPISFLEKESHRKAEQMKNPNIIIQDLLDRYGEDLFNLDGFDVKKRFENHKGQTKIIDVEIKSALQKMTLSELKELQGKKLAREISHLIKRYFVKYPPNADQIQKELEGKWISDQFNLYKPTKVDRQRFDSEQVPNLKKIYREYVESFKSLKDKSLSIQTKQKISEEEGEALSSKIKEFKEEYTKKTGIQLNSGWYPDISETGYDILLQTNDFERNCYGLSDQGITNSSYLWRVLSPLIFLGEELGEYTSFFQAKLKSGEFKIAALASAELSHYFPELAMNINNIDEEKWKMIETRIFRLILGSMREILDLYRNIGKLKRKETKHTDIGDFPWNKYTTTVSEKCQTDTKTGKIQRRDEKGNIVYKDVKLENLAICYDKKSEKFSCHSVPHMMKSIIESEPQIPINPFTGSPFPVEFIKKLKSRYPRSIAASPEIFEYNEEHFEPDIYSEEESVSLEIPRDIDREPETLEDLEAVIGKNSLVVLYFYADWCGPCNKFQEIWENIEEEYLFDAVFLKVNKDDAKEIVSKYNIRKLPSFLLLKKEGKKTKVLELLEGSDKKKLIRAIKKNI